MKFSDLIILCSTRNKKIEDFQVEMLDSFIKHTPPECKLLVIENNSDISMYKHWKNYVEDKGHFFTYADGEMNMNKFYNIGTNLTIRDYIIYASSDIIFYENWYYNLLNWFDVVDNLYVISPFTKAFESDVNAAGVYRHDTSIKHEFFDTVHIPGWFYAFKRNTNHIWDEKFKAHFQDSDLVYTVDKLRKENPNIKSGIAYNSRVDHMGGKTAANTIQDYFFEDGKQQLFKKWGYYYKLYDTTNLDDLNKYYNIYQPISSVDKQLPKTFCITLKDTPERKRITEKHFIDNKLDVIFFNGINGNTFGLKSTIPYMDDDPTGDGFLLKTGQIGCLLSHYMLWQTLWHLPHDEFLILEDDVILTENFKENFIKYKSQLPSDWQYVFVGHCCLPPEENQIKISDNIITTNHPPMCTHAYMIRRSAIPVLLDTNHIAWAAVDIQIQKKSLNFLKHYVFIPPLINQQSLMIKQGKLPDSEIFTSLI